MTRRGQRAGAGRGYFGIGVYHPKTAENIGTLWRHAMLYGASFIFTIGRRYKMQASDTPKTPLQIPLYHYDTFDDFYEHGPFSAQLVCVEMTETARQLPKFVHPRQAIYLLGAEDHGLPATLTATNMTVAIPSPSEHSMNVAVAGSIVMYDRFLKEQKNDNPMFAPEIGE